MRRSVSARSASWSRPTLTASSSERQSSIQWFASAALTSAWNWMPQAASPMR